MIKYTSTSWSFKLRRQFSSLHSSTFGVNFGPRAFTKTSFPAAQTPTSLYIQLFGSQQFAHPSPGQYSLQGLLGPNSTRRVSCATSLSLISHLSRHLSGWVWSGFLIQLYASVLGHYSSSAGQGFAMPCSFEHVPLSGGVPDGLSQPHSN